MGDPTAELDDPLAMAVHCARYMHGLMVAESSLAKKRTNTPQMSPQMAKLF